MKTTTTHSDLVWLAVIVAIGLNLRPLLTSISPLAGVILASTGLSFQGASLLTGLPVVAMGVSAFGASALAPAWWVKRAASRRVSSR
jgi:MFS transporter, CP family, cyanate transporter